MANYARPNGESDDDLFLAEVADAKPLDDRDRAPLVIPSQSQKRSVKPTRSLLLERDDERDYVEGRAHGVSRRQLDELRGGRVRPEATIDLHREARARARQRLHRFIEESSVGGRRCVLIVHGRGLHSTDGPIIKQEVMTWLAGGRHPIRAFCTAHPRDGGGGATYVLLRGT